MLSKLDGKIYAEGYCCPWAYYQLTLLRGQSQRDLGKHLDLHPTTIHYFQKRCREGKDPCRGYGDCMKPEIDQLKKQV